MTTNPHPARVPQLHSTALVAAAASGFAAGTVTKRDGGASASPAKTLTATRDVHLAKQLEGRLRDLGAGGLLDAQLVFMRRLASDAAMRGSKRQGLAVSWGDGFPEGDGDIEYLLEDGTGLAADVYSSTKEALLVQLGAVRKAASVAWQSTDGMLADQAGLRPMAACDLQGHRRIVIGKFLKARQSIINKYQTYLRNLKWLGLASSRQRRGCLTAKQNSMLRVWLFSNFQNPYPSSEEKSHLSVRTGMNITQINNWFINARVRVWKPTVELMTGEAMQREISVTGSDKQSLLEVSRDAVSRGRSSSDVDNVVLAGSDVGEGIDCVGGGMSGQFAEKNLHEVVHFGQATERFKPHHSSSAHALPIEEDHLNLLVPVQAAENHGNSEIFTIANAPEATPASSSLFPAVQLQSPAHVYMHDSITELQHYSPNHSRISGLTPSHERFRTGTRLDGRCQPHLLLGSQVECCGPIAHETGHDQLGQENAQSDGLMISALHSRTAVQAVRPVQVPEMAAGLDLFARQWLAPHDLRTAPTLHAGRLSTLAERGGTARVQISRPSTSGTISAKILPDDVGKDIVLFAASKTRPTDGNRDNRSAIGGCGFAPEALTDSDIDRLRNGRKSVRCTTPRPSDVSDENRLYGCDGDFTPLAPTLYSTLQASELVNQESLGHVQFPTGTDLAHSFQAYTEGWPQYHHKPPSFGGDQLVGCAQLGSYGYGTGRGGVTQHGSMENEFPPLNGSYFASIDQTSGSEGGASSPQCHFFFQQQSREQCCDGYHCDSTLAPHLPCTLHHYMVPQPSQPQHQLFNLQKFPTRTDSEAEIEERSDVRRIRE